MGGGLDHSWTVLERNTHRNGIRIWSEGEIVMDAAAVAKITNYSFNAPTGDISAKASVRRNRDLRPKSARGSTANLDKGRQYHRSLAERIDREGQ